MDRNGHICYFSGNGIQYACPFLAWMEGDPFALLQDLFV